MGAAVRGYCAKIISRLDESKFGRGRGINDRRDVRRFRNTRGRYDLKGWFIPGAVSMRSNGPHSPDKQAKQQGRACSERGCNWFETPVTPDRRVTWRFN